jgi:tetratricopeptide (TPR) repeat protein
MRAFIMAIGLLALALFDCALAVSEADRDACDNPSRNPNVSIKACSAVIDSLDTGYVIAIAYFNRGIAYREKGSFNNAIADFTEAISLEPRYADAYFSRGIAYSDKRNYDSAIADFDHVILLDPKDADAFVTRGMAYKEKGDYDHAIADFDEALRIDPNMKRAANAKKDAVVQLARRPAPK